MQRGFQSDHGELYISTIATGRRSLQEGTVIERRIMDQHMEYCYTLQRISHQVSVPSHNRNFVSHSSLLWDGSSTGSPPHRDLRAVAPLHPQPLVFLIHPDGEIQVKADTPAH